MPQGLLNNPSTFQRIMELIFWDMNLSELKCHLFRQQVSYLGHVVSEQGVAVDPDKIARIQGWPVGAAVFSGLGVVLPKVRGQFRKVGCSFACLDS